MKANDPNFNMKVGIFNFNLEPEPEGRIDEDLFLSHPASPKPLCQLAPLQLHSRLLVWVLSLSPAYGALLTPGCCLCPPMCLCVQVQSRDATCVMTEFRWRTGTQACLLGSFTGWKDEAMTFEFDTQVARRGW